VRPAAPFVERKRLVNPIHRRVVAACLPEWAEVEYEDEVFRAVRRAAQAEGRDVASTDGPAWNAGPAPARGYYDRDRHWREVAGPVARRTLRRRRLGGGVRRGRGARRGRPRAGRGAHDRARRGGRRRARPPGRLAETVT
jgi:hypothetical protein